MLSWILPTLSFTSSRVAPVFDAYIAAAVDRTVPTLKPKASRATATLALAGLLAAFLALGAALTLAAGFDAPLAFTGALRGLRTLAGASVTSTLLMLTSSGGGAALSGSVRFKMSGISRLSTFAFPLS